MVNQSIQIRDSMPSGKEILINTPHRKEGFGKRGFPTMFKNWLYATVITALLLSQPATAAEYAIDSQGQHAFVTFKVSHLGFSYIIGHFNRFDGHFRFDAETPENNEATVKIQANSLDTNHAERDKHLKSDEYLNVVDFPEINFISSSFEGDDKSGLLHGELSLHGVSKDISIRVHQIGEGEDPWGGYRSGFQGNVTLSAGDFGLFAWIGDVEVELIVEGIRQ